MRRFAFIFICQQGDLEIQSSLLAASLRRFLRVEHELIAAVPGPAATWGTPSEGTRIFLRRLGVRIEPVVNEIAPDYPIGNKVSALRIASSADKLVLLDSDILAMREFHDQERFDIPFNARPAGLAGFTDAGWWESAYAACGVKMPGGCIRTIGDGQYMPPYFNAGFVAVPGGIGFGQAWLDCCRSIDRTAAVPNKRPHLDQIALPVAVARLGLAYDCLDERFNFPLPLKALDARRLPIFLHYHPPTMLAREPAALAVVRELCEEHAELRAMLEGSARWKVVVDVIARGTRQPAAGAGIADGAVSLDRVAGSVAGRAAAGAADPAELIITGIARSGTSFLCNLLHRFDNCVVLNEPEEIVAASRGPSPARAVATFYRDIRRDVLAGEPIVNKLVNGQVTEDTAVNPERSTYRPAVASADFVLGMKTIMPFLSRLAPLRQAMPRARIVVCVRNPLDTIASWKTSFDFLRDADVRGRMVGDPDDPWLSGMQRRELQRVANLAEIADRRAAWWRYLAGLVLEATATLNDVVLVRYEELVSDPANIVRRILDGYDAGKLREPIVPSAPRRKAGALDGRDVQAIRALCSDVAEEMGVYRAGE
jgi:hypothetical protein